MAQLFRVYVNGGQVDHVDPGIAQKLARIHESNPDYRCSHLTFGDVPSVWIQSDGYDPRTTCAHWGIITQSLDKRPSP